MQFLCKCHWCSYIASVYVTALSSGCARHLRLYFIALIGQVSNDIRSSGSTREKTSLTTTRSQMQQKILHLFIVGMLTSRALNQFCCHTMFQIWVITQEAKKLPCFRVLIKTQHMTSSFSNSRGGGTIFNPKKIVRFCAPKEKAELIFENFRLKAKITSI